MNQGDQGLEALSLAMEADNPGLSVRTEPEQDRTEAESDYRTWNWQEAADELQIKEPTLRKIWWAAKLEPTFRHCPTPLRVVTRQTATKEIEEFTAFGMEMLHAYKAAKQKGDCAAELFLAKAKAQYPAPAIEDLPASGSSSAPPVIEVETGNHRIVWVNPELPQVYSLESLRQAESVEIEDPLLLAQQFLVAVEQVKDVMQRDIEQREQKLQQTRKAKNAVDAKAQELRLEQRLYRDRANQVSALQTEETQALQDALSTLQTLGKPTSTDSTQETG